MTIDELCRATGQAISPDAHDRIERFVAALLDENTRVNLTAIRDPEAAWVLHVCDSLALVPLLRKHGATRIVDVGTGGGAPGLVLASLMPESRFLLVDATRKKIDAVLRIALAMGLSNVTACWGRAEVLSRDAVHRGKYDAIVARAVASVSELLEFSAGFLGPGGNCFLMKSLAAVETEVADARRVAKALGLRESGVETYRLAEPHGERAIVRYMRDRR